MLLTFVLGINAAFAAVAPGDGRLETAAALAAIQGKRVGLLAHAASRDASGAHVADILYKRKDLRLVELFSPEHGLRGDADAAVPDAIDPQTGLPVYSLYGPRKAPTPEQLARIDVLLVDLQDAGVRYYTYPATTVLTLKACAAAGVPVVVLDRPNPLGASVVEGPVLDSSLVDPTNPTTIYPLPLRHGMTLGELSLLLNAKMGIGAKLTVIPMDGYRREMSWEETGLAWIPPSPALVTSEQATLYGLFGPLEAMHLAVGRGVDNSDAFREYGAPWIGEDAAQRLVARLSALALPGLEFVETSWIPTRREYQGELSRGFRVRLAGARAKGFRSLISMLEAMQAELGSPLGLELAERMLGAPWLVDALKKGDSTAVIQARARESQAGFLEDRAHFLLY